MKWTIFVLLTCVVVQSQAKCPSFCKCTESTVSCIGQRLDRVPDLLSLNVTPVIIDLSGNSFFDLGANDLDVSNAFRVIEIYLNNSEISAIDEGTFRRFSALQELYLATNLLSSDGVPANLIAGLDNMVLFDMSNNYFNEQAPSIRSDSLEVLSMVNCKIATLDVTAFSFLPALKVLLLEQNDLKVLSLEPFKHVASSNVLYVKLTYNPWKCSCDNLKAFEVMNKRGLLEEEDPYQCFDETDKLVMVFGKNGSLETMKDICHIQNVLDDQEVRDMLNDDYSVFSDEGEVPVQVMQDDNLDEDSKQGKCPNIRMENDEEEYLVMKVTVVVVAASLILGFLGGMLFCKLVFNARYRKLEQSSDSQAQLIKV